MTITSAAFGHGGEIPREHTCDGADTSPELAWSGVPEGTKSLVLIVDDPDAPDPEAPKMTYVHWVLHDMPPTATGIASASRAAVQLPAGTREGINDWKRTGYGGPCPPVGRHRYFFKLYALGVMLGDLGEAGKPEVVAAMEGHVIDKAVLMGTYSH